MKYTDGIKELSLFTGAGGGLLGTKLLGWDHVGYVEFDNYCQKVIKQRIKDGILNDAPIFSDIRTFISEGFAQQYQGMVDVITAGFPCQPFSVAGKQLGEKDERNMWPATLEVIRMVRPEVVMLENVPGLLSNGYFGRILADLSESGYDARWKVISAAEMGAPHKRDRLWIVATDTSSPPARMEKYRSRGQKRGNTSTPKSEILRQENGEGCSKGARAGCEDVANTKSAKQELARNPRTGRNGLANSCSEIPNTSSTRLEGQQLQIRARKEYPTFSGSCWWATEPELGRVAHGVASRVDRLKAIGNGQVPAVVRAAWELLN